MNRRSKTVVSIFFGLLYSFAMIYSNYGTQLFVFHVFLYVLRFVAVFSLFYFFLIPAVYNHSYLSRIFTQERGDYYKLSDKVKIYLLFAVCWLPALIIKYPSSVDYDSWVAIIQYQNKLINGMQPVFFAVMLGKILDWFGQEIGFFLFSVLQYLIMIFTFGRIISYIKSLGVTRKVRGFLLFIFIISPFTLGYIGVTLKDIIYSLALVNMVVCLLRIIESKTVLIRDIVEILIWGTVTILFRNNGIHLMILLTVFYMVEVIRKKVQVKPLLAFVSAIVLGISIVQAITVAYEVKKPDYAAREMLSIPFQQTARYVRDYGYDVTDGEKEIIGKVLAYDELAEKYDPKRSDDVKEGYSGDSESLKPYFKVWFSQFLRHPACYIHAFWEQNHYMFDIVSSTENYRFFDDSLRLADIVFSSICFTNMKLPITWINSNLALSCYIVLFSWVIAHYVKRKRSLIYYLTLFITMIIALAGPVIQGHPRYLFPVIYSAPLILIRELRNIKDDADHPCKA